MAVIGELVWKITGDDSGLSKTFKDNEKSAKSLGKQFKDVDTKAKIFGEQSKALAQKQGILRNKIEDLVSKGVNPSNKGFKKLTDQYKANQAELDKTTKKTSKYGLALKGIAIAIAAVAINKLTNFLGKSVKLASDAQETAQKFGVVFDEIAVKANNTARELAKGYNFTNTAAKEVLGSTGNVLLSFGFAQDAALEYSEELAQLGADLTSFTNFQGGSVEATRILTKAILGERDALQSLDLKITEDQLRRVAEAQGLVFKELTQQQKAELTISELRRQSAKAIGDVARSSDSYAFVTRALNNRQKDLSETVGGIFLPALTELKKAFLDSSNDGGFLFNALTLIGNAAKKVIQFVTVLVRGFDALRQVTQNNQTGLQKLSVVADKFGVSSRKVGNLVGFAKLGIIDLNKELQKAQESGNAARINLVRAAIESKKAYEDSSNKSANAIDKFKESLGRLTGTIEDGQKLNVKGFRNVSSAATNTEKSLSKASKQAKRFFELNSQEKFEAVSSGFQSIANNVINLIGAIDSFFQASTDAQLGRLEQDRQVALEAAGVAEETAVERAEKELEIAKESGEKEVIREKELLLKRTKINEEFDKKASEIEYDASVRSWELQLAQARIQQLTAPLNAYVSSLSAPWPLNMIIAPINAALALATATLQVAAVQQAKPQKPKFQEGGIVPGNLTSGDQINAGVNSGEMILTTDDQLNLLNQIRGGGGGSQMVHVVVQLDGSVIDEYITEASADGRILSDNRSAVSR